MGIYVGNNKYTGGPADPSSTMIPKSIGTAQGDIIYWSSNGVPARLAKGTAGQVLTMNSGATAPVWATPSSGGSSYDFNTVSIAYSSTYSENGISTYFADCTSAKRNIMYLNIDTTAYNSYFSQNEGLAVSLKTTDFTDNYIFIYNSTTHDIFSDYESWSFVNSSNTKEQTAYMIQKDSSSNYISIPSGKILMFGISRMQMNNETFMVITYGGTFACV